MLRAVDPERGRPGRARARTAETPLRVYRRRRLGVIVVVAALTALLSVLIGDPGAEADPDPAPAVHAVVEPGETLWEIAVERAPAGMDPRVYLDRVRRLNELGGSVPAWTVVELPG